MSDWVDDFEILNGDPWDREESEVAVPPHLVPILVSGREIPLKVYDDVLGLTVVMTEDAGRFLEDDITVYLAGWGYTTPKDGNLFLTESVFLDRHHAQRRLFELRREWHLRQVMIDEVQVDEYDRDHINTQPLHNDWYERVEPKFKLIPITINGKA